MDKGEFWKSEEYFEVIYLQVEPGCPDFDTIQFKS